MREGETSIIAGLIRDEEQIQKTGLPVLSKIPLLGDIFTDNSTSIREAEVVIALSPHVLRNLQINPEDEKMLWLGIEEQQQGGGTYRYSPVPNVPPTYEEPEQDYSTETPDDATDDMTDDTTEEDVPPEEYEDYPPGIRR